MPEQRSNKIFHYFPLNSKRRCRFLRIAFSALWLVPILLVEATAAEEPEIKAVPVSEVQTALPRGEPIILDVTFNHLKQGVIPIIITQEGDYLLRFDDLQSMGVKISGIQPIVVGREEYISLNRLDASSIRLNEQQLTLYADLPPERWPKQSTDLRAVKPQALIYPHDNSAFVNYRLLNTSSNGAPDTWLMGSEIGIRYDDLLFRSESAYLRQGDKGQSIRYGTSITHDNRDTLQRLIVGDYVTSSGNLGNTLNLGGISFSKSYTIDPYYVRQPTAGFVSSITSPSDVDIYLDGTRVQSGAYQPGEFELKNINYYGGRHDLEVVIRDAFGREQRIAYPYYFSDQNLREGLHDYSYNFGRIRTGAGTSEDTYGDWAFSGYHRYGVSDELTLGVRGEAEAAVNNMGPTAVVRLDRWGVLSGALSRSTSDNGTGWAGSMGYGYQAQKINLQGSLRRYTNTYKQVGLLPNAYRPRQELIAAVGFPVKDLGNLALGLRNLTYYQGSDQKTVSLTYSRNLYHQFNLMAAIGRTTTNVTSNYFYITLNYYPGPSFNSSYTHQQNGRNYSDTVQVGNTTPVGEGLGYRILADRTVSDGSESLRLAPWLQYNTRHAIYTANAQNVTQPDGATHTNYQWGISGGIAYVADSVSLTRPVTDSFAVVRVGDLPGVRVYNSSQEIGRTDNTGRLFVPNLGSYLVNHVSVDDRDIPIDYSLSAKELNTSPPLRSGSLIQFDVKHLQALVGHLRVKVNNRWIAAEYMELALEINGKKLSVPTGRDGEFYVENLSAGTYRVNMEDQGTICNFEMVVPESKETMIDLGEVNGCEMAH